MFDGKSKLIYHKCTMAYKIAYLYGNKSGSCPIDDFTAFAKEQGVDFVLHKLDARKIEDADLKAFSQYDAIIAAGTPVIHESVAEHIAASQNLYAKCSFKSTNISNLTAQNLVVVTDTFEIEGGGFATTKEFGREAFDTQRFSELEIERTARVAYELAEKSSRKVTLADAHESLKTANLWRKIVSDINEDYPTCALDFESTFDTARKLAENPDTYGVILTSHTNFHALSGVADLKSPLGDGTSVVAYLGETNVGLYTTERPNVYSPLFDCLALCKMLEHSFEMPALLAAWREKTQNLLQK